MEVLSLSQINQNLAFVSNLNVERSLYRMEEKVNTPLDKFIARVLPHIRREVCALHG